jgi:predicted phosphodiesterase
MLKLTHFTDSHFRLKSPRSRKPGYFDQLKEKVEYIFDEENDSDYFIITGDIGDTSNWSERLYNEVCALFSNCPADIIFIAGNHDIESQIAHKNFWLKNIRYLENVYYLPDDESIGVRNKSDIHVEFHARNFRRTRDGDISQFEGFETKENRFDIGLFHTYVLENSSSFIDHVLVDDVLNTCELDVILNGHYHESLIREQHDTLYFNPGSLARGVCNETNKGRIPKYGVLNLDSIDKEIQYELKEIEVAKAWDEVVHDFYETNQDQSLDSKKIEKSVDSLKNAKNKQTQSALKQNLKSILRDQDRDDLIETGVRLLEKAEQDLQ